MTKHSFYINICAIQININIGGRKTNIFTFIRSLISNTPRRTRSIKFVQNVEDDFSNFRINTDHVTVKGKNYFKR